MYARVGGNLWSRLYGYIKHAVEAGGYDTAKRIEKLVRSYVPDRNEKYLADGSEQYYEGSYGRKRPVMAPLYGNLFTEKDVVRDVEVSKTGPNSADKFVLRETTTIDRSVSHISSVEAITFPENSLERTGTSRADMTDDADSALGRFQGDRLQSLADMAGNGNADSDTAAGLLEGFEKSVRKDDVSLSEHQFSFLLGKMKNAEHSLVQTRKVLLAAVLVFSALTCVLLFAAR